MSDPFSAALLAFQALGPIMQGNSEAEALQAQAGVDRENARLSTLAGEQEALDVRRDARQAIGDQLAAQGASGTLTSGSNRDVLIESAMQAEMDVYNLRKRASYEAANYRQAADDKIRAAKNARTSSLFRATANVLGGVADMRAQSSLMQTSDRWRQAERAGYGGGSRSYSYTPGAGSYVPGRGYSRYR